MNDSPGPVPVVGSTSVLGHSDGHARLEALFSQPAVGIAEAGLDGRFIRASDRFCEILGRERQSLIGVHIRDVTHPDDAPENLDRFRQLVEVGEPFTMEKRYVRPDGTAAWVQVYGSPVRAEDGEIVSAIAVAFDVTASKQAQQALRESEQRFRDVADAAPVMIWLADTDNKGTWYNKAWLDFTGRTMEQELGDGWIEGVHPDDRARCAEICGGSFGRREPFRLDFRMRRADGEWRVIDDSAVPRFAEEGTFLGYIGCCIDVTHARRSEEALREQAEELKTILDAVPAVIWVARDPACMDIGGNCRAREVLKMPEGAQMSKSAPDAPAHFRVFGPGGAELAPDQLPVQVAARGTPVYGFEERIEFNDGTSIDLLGNAVPLRDSDGNVRGSVAAFVDVTERKLAEEALREETQRLEILNRTGAALASELDLQRVVQMVTDAGVALSGAEFGAFFYNVIGQAGEAYMLYTLSGADRSAFEQFGMPRNTKVFAPTFAGEGVVRSNDITKDPRYGRNKPHKGMPDGHLPVVSYLAVPVVGRSGEVIGGLFFGHREAGRFTDRHEQLMTAIAAQAAIAIDNARLYQTVQQANDTLEHRVEERTRELERANEALRQAQKMEAIGQLTGGIAHDFNNMLTVIRGSADVLQRSDLPEEKRRKYIDAIADTSDRAARLTSQLLAFARRQALKPELFDAAERVRGISDMLRTILGSGIWLEIRTDCADCFVKADAAQFETAVLNMAVNARDAMSGEGDLAIEIARAADGPRSMERSPDGYVAVRVADTGHGIGPEDLDKIFDPFFTTKEVGKGTGLGLSQVYGFAKQSGGDVNVQSRVGEGTTFTLYLPAATAPGETGEESASAIPALPEGARILVVEDNEEVGRFAEQVIRDLGFRALLAGSAADALSLLDGGGGFDLVFTDVVMPGTDGIAFAKQVRARWPTMPVVLTSGFSDVLASEAGLDFPLLQKPYSLESLSRALAEAMKH